MADDIHELLDEVESKYNDSEHGSQLLSIKKSGTPIAAEIYANGTEEINAAVHSICDIAGPIQTIISQSDYEFHHMAPQRSGGVMLVRNASPGAGLPSGTSCRRNSSYKRQRPSSTSNTCNKRFFAKPVFELSVKDLEAERARRRQKEVIERLFERNQAVVIPKIILDERKYKRIKSNVWEFFGDVRLFISEAESKGYNIDCNVIHIHEEELLVCKSFVACKTCCAVFSYESHSYGTSTLRSHLRSCGKPRFNRKEKNSGHVLDRKPLPNEASLYSCRDDPFDEPRTGCEELMVNFREECGKLKKQIATFFLSGGKSFETIKNPEFKKLLQMCIKIGSISGKTDIQHILCSKDRLADLIQNLYSTSAVEFNSDMENVYGVSFSFELWKDVSKDVSYLNMLCYYSNDKGALKSVIVQTTEFAFESKRGSDLGIAFSTCLNDTRLYVFRRLLVIDHSENMIEAFQTEQFIFCICHCVDWVVQHVLYSVITFDGVNDQVAFPGFVELINECSALVLHFRYNKIQRNLPNSLLLCSSDCNWISVLKMLKSIDNQWDHITDILDEREELDQFNIDVELLNVVIDFLQIFYDGVVELASVNYPTLNLVIPWWATWKSHCLQGEDELYGFAVLKSLMNVQIDRVTGSISLYHKLATMLDPRFKQLEFLTEEDRTLVQTEAEKFVKECEDSFIEKKLFERSCCDVSDADNVSNLYSDPQTRVNLESYSNSSCEVSNYLAEPYSINGDDLDTEGKFNPLKYWTRVKSSYPYLYKVASWILSCPASSLRNNERLSENNWMVSVGDNEFPSDAMHLCLFSKSFKNL